MPARPVAPEEPNILLVVCHDLGRHLPCYGVRGLHTPNIDRLAADGGVCDRYFATAPLCSPSRGSILTGCYPHANGLMGLVNRGWDMPDRTPTLPQLLREAGYVSYLFGFHHEKKDPRRMGYDHVPPARAPIYAGAVLPSMAEFLHGAREATRGNPFLAVAGLFEVHRPFKNPRYTPADPAAVDVPGFLPDHPGVREDLADLAGLVEAVDLHLGTVLDALADTGLDRRTLVILTTDHGIAFPRAKSTLYDAGIGTALIARWPGVIPPGSRIDELLSNVDLLPTLLSAAGREVPPHVQGRSFLPLLRGEGGGGDEAVFAEKTYHDAYDPKRAVRTDRWKYIRNFEPGPELLLPADIAPSPSAAAVADAADRPRPEEELYDLAADPFERRNLAADPAYGSDLAEMRARLAGWMEGTGDPLLRGAIPDAGAGAARG